MTCWLPETDDEFRPTTNALTFQLCNVGCFTGDKTDLAFTFNPDSVQLQVCSHSQVSQCHLNDTQARVCAISCNLSSGSAKSAVQDQNSGWDRKLWFRAVEARGGKDIPNISIRVIHRGHRDKKLSLVTVIKIAR